MIKDNNYTISTVDILRVINKLPHSEGRVPYTYHHDYLRDKSNLHKGMSRAEVSASHSDNMLEMYAISLVSIVDSIASDVMLLIEVEDMLVYKESKLIANAVLLKYNKI